MSDKLYTSVIQDLRRENARLRLAYDRTSREAHRYHLALELIANASQGWLQGHARRVLEEPSTLQEWQGGIGK